MEYIFVYSYQPRRYSGDKPRILGRRVFDMEPGLTIDEMICKVEDHLHTHQPWWCDARVINVIPNTVPEQIDILYLCDGKQCYDGPCRNGDCEHTHDINHALHKDNLEGRLFKYMEKGTGGRIGFFEVKESEE